MTSSDKKLSLKKSIKKTIDPCIGSVNELETRRLKKIELPRIGSKNIIEDCSRFITFA